MNNLYSSPIPSPNLVQIKIKEGEKDKKFIKKIYPFFKPNHN